MKRDSNVFKGSPGTITVFLAVILMSILAFAGAAIDIVRISAAERKLQGALNSSVRSALAGYDRDLAGDYGLYALNAGSNTALNQEVYRYLRLNLQERNKGIGILSFEILPDDVRLEGMEGLTGDETFKRQVLEYMKYRTPVYTAQSLYEQFKNIRLDKKLNFAESEKTARQKAATVRSKVNELNGRLKGIADSIAHISADELEGFCGRLQEALELDGEIYSGDRENLLEDYEDSRELSDEKARDAGGEGNTSKEFDTVRDDSVKRMEELKVLLAESKSALAVVKPLITELNNLKENRDSIEERLSKLRKKLKDLKDSGNDASDKADGIREDIAELEDELQELLEDIQELESGLEERMQRLRAELGRVNMEGLALRPENTTVTHKTALDFSGYLEEKKKEIQRLLFASIQPDWLIQAADLVQTPEDSLPEGLEDDFHIGNAIPEEQAESHNDKVMSGIGRILSALQDTAAAVRDKAYIVDYIMDKYTFLTTHTEREHFYRRGEVEYILCGSGQGEAYDTLANAEYVVIAKALSRVWMLRFAIDAIDEFAVSKIPFPPQRLAWALAEGAVDSGNEMLLMLRGESVLICPNSPADIRLKYSDHLRLLLYMKPEEELLRKARQLVQVNIMNSPGKAGGGRKDFRLSDYDTAVYGKVRARVGLFFLPFLHLDKILPERFERGAYILEKEVYMGY